MSPRACAHAVCARWALDSMSLWPVSRGVRMTPRYRYSGVRRSESPVTSAKQEAAGVTTENLTSNLPGFGPCDRHTIASVCPAPGFTRKGRNLSVLRATAAIHGN